ncbi:MAG: hypothetical protein E7259_08250 [Lachnospiraceae bacterium]|nr:hypothetical protein [Lachnospiraceae bacterium]
MDNNFNEELKKAEAEQANVEAAANETVENAEQKIEEAKEATVENEQPAEAIQPAEEVTEPATELVEQPAPAQEAPQAEQTAQEMPQAQPEATPAFQAQPVQDVMAPAQPEGGKPKKVKKPLSKGAIAGIVTGGVALVAAVVCGIIFLPKLFRSDKEVVMDAVAETFTFSSSSNYIDELIDPVAVNEAYYSEGGSVNYNMALESVLGEDSFSGWQLAVDSAFDPVNQLANTTTTLDYNDVNILSISDAVTSDTMYLMLSNVAEAYLSLPTENTLVALQDSELGQAMDMYGMPAYSINYFGNSSDGEDNSYLVFADDLEKIWDSATFEKQKGKVKITVNGEDITAKEYFITIKEDDMKESLELFLTDMMSIVSSDPAMLESMGLDQATFDMYVNLAIGEIVSMINEDLVIKVYIKGDRIVKITNSYTLSYGGVDLTGDFYVDIDENDMSGALKLYAMGEEVGVLVDVKDVYGDANGTVTCYYGDEEVTCSFESVVEDEDSQYKADVTGEVYYADETILTYSVSSEISKDDNTFAEEITISVIDGEDTYPVTVAWSGAVEDVETGVKYTINLDKIEVLYEDQSIVTLSANYTCDTSVVDAVGPDSSIEVYDLTSTSIEDLENLVLDNQNKIINWVKDIIMETGEVGQLIDEYLFDGQASSFLQIF